MSDSLNTREIGPVIEELVQPTLDAIAPIPALVAQVIESVDLAEELVTQVDMTAEAVALDAQQVGTDRVTVLGLLTQTGTARDAAAGSAAAAVLDRNAALAAQAQAQAFALAASAAATASMNAGGIKYATIAAGLVATAEGGVFTVVGVGDTYATDYVKTGGVAVAGQSYPSVARIDALPIKIRPGDMAFEVSDDFYNMLIGITKDQKLIQPDFLNQVARLDILTPKVDAFAQAGAQIAKRNGYAFVLEDDAGNLLFGIRNNTLLDFENPGINAMRAAITALQAAVSGGGVTIVQRPGWAVAFEDDGQNLLLGIRSDTLEVVSPTIARLDANIVRLDALIAEGGGGGGDGTIIDAMVPEAIYVRQNETSYVYTEGIILNPTVKPVWNKSLANDVVCPITATGETEANLTLDVYTPSNTKTRVADIPVFVIGTPVSPTVPQNYIAFGDSKTQGAGDNTPGAYVNELSRRLTGFGTPSLSDPALTPAPLSLTNMYFRGTLGTAAVKHEGRPGWNADKYMRTPTTGSGSGIIYNNFWNPATLKFDLAYYMQTYGFRSVDTAGGVLPDGSNLTILMWMGWNDVYLRTLPESVVMMGQLIDLMQLAYPNIEIIMMGLNPPPRLMWKAFDPESGREVSQRALWEEVIKPYGRAYRTLAATKTNVQFYQISHLVDANIAHNSIALKTNPRSAVTLSANSDYVHENRTGNAMICDALFPLMLWRDCRGV